MSYTYHKAVARVIHASLPVLDLTTFRAALASAMGSSRLPFVIVSVSGGADSMTLWHLVRASALAHSRLARQLRPTRRR